MSGLKHEIVGLVIFLRVALGLALNRLRLAFYLVVLLLKLGMINFAVILLLNCLVEVIAQI